MTGAAFILPILTESNTSCYHCTYQSECGDQRAHERHCVEVHCWRHAGHTPPVSNVFHSWPQLQDQRSSFWGDQPQSGHRMRGPDGSRLFSWSSSRSKTMDDLVESSARAHMSPHYVPLWFGDSPQESSDQCGMQASTRPKQRELTTSTRLVPEF